MAVASGLIAVLYDTRTKRLLGRDGKFVSVEEFLRYPPERQADLVPREGTPSVDDPKDVEGDPGPVRKCINGKEHWCYLNQCYATGANC